MVGMINQLSLKLLIRSGLSLVLTPALTVVVGAAAPASRIDAGIIQIIEGHNKRTDAKIQDQVRMKLANDPVVKGGVIRVEVEEGIVTLRGQVETTRKKERAERLAKSVKGVKSVINQLAVGPPVS